MKRKGLLVLVLVGLTLTLGKSGDAVRQTRKIYFPVEEEEGDLDILDTANYSPNVKEYERPGKPAGLNGRAAGGDPPAGGAGGAPPAGGEPPAGGAAAELPGGAAGGKPPPTGGGGIELHQAGAARSGGGAPLMDFPNPDAGSEPPFPEWPAASEGRVDGSGPPVMDPNAPIPPCPPETNSMSRSIDKVKDTGDSALERIKTQDRYLQIQAHKIAIWGLPDELKQEPAASFKILNETVKVFKTKCPGGRYIPEDWVDNVVMTFSLLHRYLTPSRESFITEEEEVWIMNLLEKCMAGDSLQNSFSLDTGCGDEILGDSARHAICEPVTESSDAQYYDPLLDIIWRIFETVHFGCFDTFQGYSRVWHRYSIGVEDLFNLAVKQRWDNPHGGDVYFKRLIGPNYKTYAANIGKCAQTYASRSAVGARLHRFEQPYVVRYSANVREPFKPRPTPPPRPVPGASPAGGDAGK